MKWFGTRHREIPADEMKVSPADRLIVLAERNIALARDLQLLVLELQVRQGGRA